VTDREDLRSTSIRASGASAVPGRRGRRPSRPPFSSTFLRRVVRRRRTRGGKRSRPLCSSLLTNYSFAVSRRAEYREWISQPSRDETGRYGSGVLNSECGAQDVEVSPVRIARTRDDCGTNNVPPLTESSISGAKSDRDSSLPAGERQWIASPVPT
jgi:hypothetical protein